MLIEVGDKSFSSSFLLASFYYFSVSFSSSTFLSFFSFSAVLDIYFSGPNRLRDWVLVTDTALEKTDLLFSSLRFADKPESRQSKLAKEARFFSFKSAHTYDINIG